MVDAGAGRRHRAAIAGRNGQPASVYLGAILRRFRDLAVFFEQRVHDVVDRHEPVFLRVHVPSPQPDNVMPGPGLALGHQGQQILVAIRCDQVEFEVHLFLFRPLLAYPLQDLAGPRNPMVPGSDGERPGGVGTVHEWGRKRGGDYGRGQRSSLQYGAARQRRR